MSATVPTAPADFDRSRLTWVERGLRVFTDVRPGEGRTALLMFANVFLILCAYYFIKPLREGWIAVSGVGGLSKLEMRAYTAFGQSLLLIPVVAGYGRLVGRWPRAVLIERATLFCMANMLVFWALQPNFLLSRTCPTSGSSSISGWGCSRSSWSRSSGPSRRTSTPRSAATACSR